MTKVQKSLIAISLTLLVLINTVFVIDQRQQALVLQFGEAIRVINTPGLKFKLPFVQNVLFFDKRILDLGIREQEVIASDQKRLIIDAFTKYKIVDPLKFYTTVNNKINAENKLTAILDSSLRRVVGEVPLNMLLSEERNLIMAKIKELLGSETKIFGIDIIDVRIVSGNLPKENSEAIFLRMQTEREKEAREIRATGAEEGERIRAEADKARSIIIAEAKKQSDVTRGTGDAEASKIFAKAYTKDPEFFDFYRSMQAYNEALKSDKTTIVLSPDSEFFKHFSKTKN